ncbi:MAG: hypothetical protein U9Q82_11290 [Chloroflexota bacterium]|nr:hypothetical protein [Chloroflexota bacterium]
METQLPFLLSDASERIIRGGVRGGKTILASAECASAATGIPLTGPDGKELPYRYPRNKPGKQRRALTIWIIGFDQDHIGKIYKYLFVAGAFAKFRILNDPETGKLRSWRPWDPEDAKLEELTTPHPPMIPRRFCPIDRPPTLTTPGMAFENKGEHIFSLAKLTNGTEIYAMPSGGNPGMGVAVDLIWIDEDIKYPGHVQEWQSRLSDVKGRLMWSAFPWADNDALELMSNRAEKESTLKHPDITETVLKYSKNPYIPKEEIRKRRKAWRAAGEGVLRARDYGEFLTGLSLVFPDFDIDLHGIPCMERENDPLDKILAKTNFQIPDNWTRYLGIDPGFVNPALVFVAIPPLELGDYYIVYDEIYIGRATPQDVIKELKTKLGHWQFHKFIIDNRFGRQAETGGKSVTQQWAEAFEKAEIRSRLTYSSFAPGNDNIYARNMVVRKMLESQADGTTKFRIFRDTTPHMQREFGLYRRNAGRDDTSEKIRAKHNHAMDANAYVAADYPEYYAPPLSEKQKCPAALAIEYLKRHGQKKQSDAIYLGAGAAPESPTF